jgi:hypothetical protein
MPIASSAVATAKATRLQRYCQAARLAIVLGALLVVLEPCIDILSPPLGGNVNSAQWLFLVKMWAGIQTPTEGLSVSSAQLLVMGAIDIVPRLMLLFGLSQLWIYFGACMTGRAFDRSALRRIWFFALGFLGTAVTQMTMQTMVWRVMTMGVKDAAPHFGPMVIITGEQVLAILLSASVFGIAAVLSEATRLADEVREFV